MLYPSLQRMDPVNAWRYMFFLGGLPAAERFPWMTGGVRSVIERRAQGASSVLLRKASVTSCSDAVSKDASA